MYEFDFNIDRNKLRTNEQKLAYVEHQVIFTFNMAMEEKQDNPKIDPLRLAMIERENCWDYFEYLQS